MQKIIKLGMRVFVTLILSLLILFSIDRILKIKHREETNYEWTWYEENNLLYVMQLDKYPSADSLDFPVVMLKNEEIPEKEKDEKRILVIGDSFTYNYGGDNINYTWWKQLNRKIKEEGYSNVNVYATGKPFTNTADELEKVLNNEQLMERIDPDLIIVGYVRNDPEERDETNSYNLLKQIGDQPPENNEIYKNNPTLYQEMIERYSSMEVDYDKLKSMGDLLGLYRDDIWALLLVEGENLQKYKDVLKKFDNRMKELDIPYFFYFTDIRDGNKLIEQALDTVLNAMKELGISTQIVPYDYEYIGINLPQTKEDYRFGINPVDEHPGVAVNHVFATNALDILKKNYSFIFENKVYQDINELELNINDTMPFLDVKKVKNNVYEFEYPEEEETRTLESKFLYFPIEKEYVKLNLEFPKNIKEIIVTGDNLKSAEIYVNTFDEEYDIDLNEMKKELTSCKNTGNNTYSVKQMITSVNIVANFTNSGDRKIKIEFIEN